MTEGVPQCDGSGGLSAGFVVLCVCVWVFHGGGLAGEFTEAWPSFWDFLPLLLFEVDSLLGGLAIGTIHGLWPQSLSRV